MACLLCRHALNNSVRRWRRSGHDGKRPWTKPAWGGGSSSKSLKLESLSQHRNAKKRRVQWFRLQHKHWLCAWGSCRASCHGSVSGRGSLVCVTQAQSKKKKKQTKAKGLHAESLWLVVLLRHIKLGNQKGKASVSPGEHQCRGEEARTIMASHNNATGRDQREKKKKERKDPGSGWGNPGAAKEHPPAKNHRSRPQTRAWPEQKLMPSLWPVCATNLCALLSQATLFNTTNLDGTTGCWYIPAADCWRCTCERRQEKLFFFHRRVCISSAIHPTGHY